MPQRPQFEAQIKSELHRIVEALVIESPGSFTFGGRRVQASGSAGIPSLSGVPIQNPLVGALQMQLYLHCYSRRFAGAISEAKLPNDDGKDLTMDLAQANTSQERWESGWKISQIMSSGQIAVQRDGLNRVLWPGEYLAADGAAGMPRRGSFVSVYCRKQSTTIQPGFYFAFGEMLPDQQDEMNPVRFYWNIEPAGMIDLMRLLTGVLNRFQVPFRFKCLARSTYYDRADAAVLYVSKRYYRITAELLIGVREGVAAHLRQDTPLFSKPVAAGLGIAEDPGNGESFGTHRCRLVAEALCHAEARGRRATGERLQEIENHFQQFGLTLASPYLGSGSVDVYDWPIGEVALS